MESVRPKGYMGKILRVDLTQGRMAEEVPDFTTLRLYVGGTGLAVKILYDEVPPGVQWDDPLNRLIFATGPVGGTRFGGSGSISVVTKGPLTNGATSTQTNGFIGAFLKFSGFDGIIFQGAAAEWVYLWVHDGKAELRDASHLVGKDTWETGELIGRELGKKERELSVFSIGPAGEHRVAFASIHGDKGHVASHGGAGAVMGSKRLKAIAVARGKQTVEVADRERVSFLAKDLHEKVTATPGSASYRTSRWGTTGNIDFNKARISTGSLPVKNYTTSYFPKYIEFSREHLDPLFEVENAPCWACRFTHCRMLKVKEGPYKGYVGEEPEYEQWAHWGPAIGQKDQIKAFVLSNEVDKLGMDTNHAGWVIAWLMECCDKELIGPSDLDGLEMAWGDADTALAMLKKIAFREGVGDVLARGLSRAIESFPPEARKLAIYTKKGNTPRAHDHRTSWRMMLDTCVSDTGTDEAGSMATKADDADLPKDVDTLSPEMNATWLARVINRMPLDDSLLMCRFNNRGPGVDMNYLAGMLKAVTGWDFTGEEVSAAGTRIVHLLRAFNMRHGLTAEMDAPSPRYGSAPIDGPYQGVSIKPVWKELVNRFYELMGWDIETGKPLPETLRRYGLDDVVRELW